MVRHSPTVGSVIKQARDAKGMSQDELADALGISQQAVTKWETGKSVPRLSTLRKLAALLDVNVLDLIQATGKFDDLVFEDEASGVVIPRKEAPDQELLLNALNADLGDLTPPEIAQVRAFLQGLKAGRPK